MNYVSNVHRFILDILFPITCLGCGKEGAWLCEPCLALLPLEDEHVCPICEKTPTPSGRTCFGCRKKSPLDALLPAFSYDRELVRRAVHHYKYRFIPELHLPLGSLLVAALLQNDLPVPDLVIPVPLHRRRLRWRGFNQAQILAQHVGTFLTPGFPISVRADVLGRKRYTLPQMGIKDKSQRRRNIEGAFIFSSGAEVKNKSILLVDDVATTGATIFECARILKEAGAKQVWAVVIARQQYTAKSRH